MNWIVMILLLLACTKKEKTIGKSELYKTAVQVESTLELVVPKEMTGGVRCSDYGEGCVGAFSVRVYGVEMIAVEFNNSENAKLSALKIDGYLYYNWLFDDVTGEPILEEFVKKAFNATRPAKDLLGTK